MVALDADTDSALALDPALSSGVVMGKRVCDTLTVGEHP